jgi:MoaA/NifB/PqqE/SkfB family radical SAM enzyme
MKKLSKVVWAGVPDSLCNLNCSYCYTGENKGQKGEYIYTVEHMLECFEPKRFGGPVFFEGTAAGETLLWDKIVDFTKGMLSYGHVVSYTTNMTVTPAIEEFCDFPMELRSRLVFDASLHYLELRRKKLLDTFFGNLRMLKSAGISFATKVCISDTYITHLREISDLCQKEIGLLPLAGMERNYERNGGRIARKYSQDVSKLVKETCDARAWELHRRIYGHRRTEFCHAGEYSINLNLGTGDYTKCWGRSGRRKNWRQSLAGSESELFRKVPLVNKLTNRLFREPSQIVGNIFKNPNKPIKFEPIGGCPFYDCVCAGWLCWGLIPELSVETHSRTYFTREFVSPQVWDLMDSKID